MESKLIDILLFSPLDIQPEKIIIFWKKLDELSLKHIQAIFTSKEVYIVSENKPNIELLPNIKFVDSQNILPEDKHMDLVITNVFDESNDLTKHLLNISKIMETFSPNLIICDSYNNLTKALFNEYNKKGKWFIYKPTKDLWDGYYFYDRNFPNLVFIKKA